MAKLTDKEITTFKKGLDLLFADVSGELDEMTYGALLGDYTRPPTMTAIRAQLRQYDQYKKPKITGKKWRSNLSQVETGILDGLKGYELFISGSDAGKELDPKTGKKVVKWFSAPGGQKVRKDTLSAELHVARATGKTLEKSPKKRLQWAKLERATYKRTLKAVEAMGDEHATKMFISHSDAKTQGAVEASEKMVETWIKEGAADLKIKDPMKDAKTKNKCYDRAKEMEKEEGVTIHECPQYAIKHRNALLEIYEDIQTEKKSAKMKNKKDGVATPYQASNIKDPCNEHIRGMSKKHTEVKKLFAPHTATGGKVVSVVDKGTVEMFLKGKG